MTVPMNHHCNREDVIIQLPLRNRTLRDQLWTMQSDLIFRICIKGIGSGFGRTLVQ